ncbi:M23 family metallopeptidase [Solimonas marina]|uniref:M23 family metallopeptidase n=1 Tax=Solimonas marina TaxID=2714601 RepID=A0A969WBF8_9GAMM|nr:M23 family metallopeptidase [Solimonas marina]NKF22938.1 M23 family metallopeptidase [Solimonas marina]
MDIIVVSHERGRTWRFALGLRHVTIWLPFAVIGVLLLASSYFVGYWTRGGSSVLPPRLVAKWAKEVDQQRAELGTAREAAEENAAALSRRLAELQAQVMRLDAAGQRLTEIAGLDSGEFDFSQPPPVGGPELATSTATPLDPVMQSLDAYARQLSDRERQFRVLEDLLVASRLQKEVRPTGWPISSGWISSLFGTRTDPFTGRLARHEGMDFAAPMGSAVNAVAAGMVTYAGPMSGYGNLVEINHGNGYSTRYGHNSKVLVHVGDRVERGQAIARIGSTGRSTGPHVHFEVLYNGQQVDPQRYIQVAR